MIGNFYLAVSDILVCLVVVCILFFLIYLLGQKFKKILKLLLYEGKSNLFVLRILIDLVSNYPLYLIKNLAQAEANSHIDPFAGYLGALFLLCLISYMLFNALKGFKIMKWRPLFIVLFIQILLTSVIWVNCYLSIDCAICNIDI